MSDERVESVHRRSTGEILLQGTLRLILVLLAPWLRLDRDAPVAVRLWRWRYVYLAFGGMALVASWEGATAGTLRPLWLAIGPHVVGAVLFVRAYVGGPVPGIGLPLVSVPDTWILGGVVVGGWAVVAVQASRYRIPVLGLPPVTYYERGAEEYVVPVSTARESTDAPPLPRLDQEVSTLVLGETGSGKTSALHLLAYQLPYDAGTAVIVHDFGTEYRRFYRNLGFDVVRIAVDDSDVVWNLFADVQQEREFRELAGAVFGEPRGSDPFHRPAKQVFEAALKYVHREYGEPATGDPPDHTDLLEFLQNDRATIQHLLEEHADLAGAAAHLDTETGKSAMNVYQSLREHVEAVFVGDFAAKGEFSLREYVEEPGGRVLIVDSTPAETETVGPMFRLLLDWAIRYAMGTETPVNFVLDEVDQLPALSQLPTLAARGRAENSRVLVGVQTLGQLEAQYGDDVNGVIGNCPQGIYFSGGDPETIEYVQSEVGQERQFADSKTVRTSGGRHSKSHSRSVSETDRHPVPSGPLKQFGTGDCIVKSRRHWWLGSLSQLGEVAHRLPADPDPDSAATEFKSEEADPSPGPEHGEPATPDAGVGSAPSTDRDRTPPALPAPGDASEAETAGVVASAGEERDHAGSAASPEATQADPPGHDHTVEADSYPADLKTLDQWLTWKPTEDGRKVPRAPWTNTWEDEYVDAQDPKHWTSYGRAREAADQYPGHDLAFVVRDRDEFPDETLVLVDYDHARDPDTGALHPTVREHVERADSYADVSTSGTGVHVLCRGELPEGVKSIDAPLPDDPDFPDAAIEVYDSARFVAMTGDHLAGTPDRTTECQEFLDDLAETFATVSEHAPDTLTEEPVRSRAELAHIETTDEMQDVFDAIQHVRPEDVRLRSTVTETRSDGSKSLDPSWVTSKSGTRLAQVEDGWIYRKGMHGLDAVQVVALEEGIIRQPDHYPKGEDFWTAVRALRDRGGHVPLFEPKESPDGS